MRPNRILHIVGGMNRGGAETWLMHVLRHIDRKSFQMDFLVHTEQKCAYDDEIRRLGSNIIPCLHPSRPWKYGRTFKRILREYGPYDVLHSHTHLFSGFVLRLAHQAGVRIRIAHSHNDTSSVQAQAGLYRRLYQKLMKKWVQQHATAGLGCTKNAAAALFGTEWKSDSRWKVLSYGIDLTPFHLSVEPTEIRSDLGIPQDAFVIGHVGNFTEQKNHAFLLKVAAEIARHEPKMRLLLVGDGPLRPSIERQVAQAGISSQLIFTGFRGDVPRLMLGAMDAFIFPSLFEGLGIVLLEAQAAGLPCIFADVVPEEADVIPILLQRLPLTQPPAIWAEAVLKTINQAPPVTQREALAIMENSHFNIFSRINELENIYSGQGHSG